MADRNRPPAADAPSRVNVSPSADRQSTTGSAIYETASKKAPMSEEPPAVAALRRALESDGDLSTKAYDIDELNRLKAASNRSSAVLAAGDDHHGAEEAEDAATGRVELGALPPQVRQIVVPMAASDDDDPLDDGPTRMRPVDDPRENKRPMVRPAAGMRPMPAAPARSAPEISTSAPHDEDSTDDGPTLNKKDNNQAVRDVVRAQLAPAQVAARTAPQPQPPPPPDADEDDPLDDGPTRMRPQEDFPLPSGRIPPPPPAVEIDRGSKTAILESLREGGASGRGGWDDDALDPLTGATTKLPGSEVQRAVIAAHLEAGPKQAPMMTSPFPAMGGTATLSLPTLPNNAPAPSWGGAPMVAPPVGPPPVAPPVGPPLGMPAPPAALAPPAGPTALPVVPPASSANRQRLVAALVGVMLGLAVLFVYGAFSEPDAVEPTSASASAVASVAPPPPPKPSVTEAPSAAPPPPVNVAEEEARAALTKLRDAISACIQKNPGALPETASAVPRSLNLTRPDGYTAKSEDWKAGIWSCSKWRPAGAMHYQLQWQAAKPFTEGTAVVWIDNNGDGTADRAFSFHATLKSKGKLDVGEIGPIDASRKVWTP